MSRFEGVNGRSELALQAESSIHPLHTVTNELTGYFEATIDGGGQIDLSAPVSGQIEILVSNLKSNNNFVDRELHNRLNVQRYPRIVAKLLEIKKGKGDGKYAAVGDLSFHGVTRRLEDELIVRQVDERTVEIQGDIVLDVRNFNVEPPKLLMLRVHPEVEVKLHFVAQLDGKGS